MTEYVNLRLPADVSLIGLARAMAGLGLTLVDNGPGTLRADRVRSELKPICSFSGCSRVAGVRVAARDYCPAHGIEAMRREGGL